MWQGVVVLIAASMIVLLVAGVMVKQALVLAGDARGVCGALVFCSFNGGSLFLHIARGDSTARAIGVALRWLVFLCSVW